VRIAACLAILLTAGAAQAQQPGRENFRAATAADLARVCSAAVSGVDPNHQLAFCHGVLAGAYGYFDSTVPAADRFVCLPTNPSPSRAKVAEGFVAWLKARPQYNGDGAIDALFRYAAEVFPCKR
jgi:hypothetical protein